MTGCTRRRLTRRGRALEYEPTRNVVLSAGQVGGSRWPWPRRRDTVGTVGRLPMVPACPTARPEPMTMSTPRATRTGCDDFRSALRTDRRGFVKAGVLGAAGLCLPSLLRAEEQRTSSLSQVNSVILLWMRGGPS